MEFHKLHSLGNHFMLLTQEDCPILYTQEVQRFADPKTGVGFDQLLYITKHEQPDTFLYRIFNADGQEVSQCGNGTRAVACFRYHTTGATHTRLISRESDMQVEYKNDEHIITTFPLPHCLPEQIPTTLIPNADTRYTLELLDRTWNFFATNVGNPHILITNWQAGDPPLTAIGAACNQHPAFPEGVNISIGCWSEKHIELQIYERGVGLTNACGSAALAAASLLIQQKAIQPICTVNMPGGSVHINWEDHSQLKMSGPACYVYVGRGFL